MNIIKEENDLILHVEIDDNFYFGESFRSKIEENKTVRLHNTFTLNNAFLLKHEVVDYIEAKLLKRLKMRCIFDKALKGIIGLLKTVDSLDNKTG